MRRLMTLFAFVLVGLIMAASVDAQRRGTADKARRWADTNHRLELRYTLETEEDGEPDSAAATQGFESGDRFTLRVRPTDDAYLYLFVSDPDGADQRQLFLPVAEDAIGRFVEPPRTV